MDSFHSLGEILKAETKTTDKQAVFMMDVIEEIIKFRKDLDDAKKEIRGINGKNKKIHTSEKNKTCQSRTCGFKTCIKKEATGGKKIKTCSKEKTITGEKNIIPDSQYKQEDPV